MDGSLHQQIVPSAQLWDLCMMQKYQGDRRACFRWQKQFGGIGKCISLRLQLRGDRKLQQISTAPTKAKSREPAYSKALNQSEIDRQPTDCVGWRVEGRKSLIRVGNYGEISSAKAFFVISQIISYPRWAGGVYMLMNERKGNNRKAEWRLQENWY